MIMHDFKCPKCSKLYTVQIPSDYSKPIKCPHCKKDMKKVWRKAPLGIVR